jgi:hypothetical protein
MGHHAGFDIFAVQRDGIAMGAAQIALLFQQIQILANGDFRDTGHLRQIGDAHAAFIDDHLQNTLLSGVHSNITVRGLYGEQPV